LVLPGIPWQMTREGKGKEEPTGWYISPKILNPSLFQTIFSLFIGQRPFSSGRGIFPNGLDEDGA